MMDMLIPLALINVAAFVWLVLAIRHVMGLLGGYGNGMQGGPILSTALDYAFNATMATVVVIVADVFALFYFLANT